MSGQELNLEKKKRGRPTTGRGVQLNAMVRPELVTAIDDWSSKQIPPIATRTEAIRLIVEAYLKDQKIIP